MTNKRMDVDLTDEPNNSNNNVVDASVGDTPATSDDKEALTPKEVARRLLDNADSPSDALEGANKALQRHIQKYEKCQQHIDDQKSRIESLQETADRVANLPEDALCLQTLEGGISVEVKYDDDQYSQDDLIDDIYDAIETREDRAEDAQEKLQTLEAECATIRQAAKDIENLKELTGDQQSRTQQVPEEERWPEG